MSGMTVACVLKSGGVYDGEWVRRLRGQVNWHLKAEHDFACLTDVDVDGVDTEPLGLDLPGRINVR